ncbi:MAG: hypothetical protein EOO57_00720 [Hymenobacter sp.]|nr:MAG: hypothetical protein EOO57_00720 [Hymenobacter sp.]
MLRKLLPIFCFSTFLSTSSAFAQVTPPGKKPPVAPIKPAPAASAEERANALTNNMVQELGLTPAQAEKLRAINSKALRSGEAARQRYADDPAKFRGSIEDITLARLEQLKDVLTPAQFNRYQQKREAKLGVPTVRGYQGTPPPSLGSGRGGDE